MQPAAVSKSETKAKAAKEDAMPNIPSRVTSGLPDVAAVQSSKAKPPKPTRPPMKPTAAPESEQVLNAATYKAPPLRPPPAKGTVLQQQVEEAMMNPAFAKSPNLGQSSLSRCQRKHTG